MADTMTMIAAIEWIVVGVIYLIGLRKWNRKFTALHDELKKAIEEEPA